MQRVRQAMRVADQAGDAGAPPLDELVDMGFGRPAGRRGFLAAAGAAGLGLAAGTVPALGQNRSEARIAIVGAGLAGLTAADELRRAGLKPVIYEAVGMPGGRVRSVRGLIGDTLVTELGASFIGPDHSEMIGLARRLGVLLHDFEKKPPGPKPVELIYAGGQRRSERSIVKAYEPFAKRIRADRAKTRRDLRALAHFDQMTMAEYMERLGMTGWPRDLMARAFAAEVGLDPDQLSALYLVEGFEDDLFESDFRYRAEGGNQRIVQKLAATLDGAIRTDYRLRALAPDGTGFRLSFERAGGAMVDVKADAVVLALPFSLLRRCDLRVPLPPGQTRAIRELGYGTNAKLFAGQSTRVFQGAVISDEPYDAAWDNTTYQPGRAGGLTLFGGGSIGLGFRDRSRANVARLVGRLDKAAPGVARAFNGRAGGFHWPGYRWARGSYACFKPGQFTRLQQWIAKPSGRIFFAGEHTNWDYQGFMEGAARSGRRAAKEVRKALGV